MEMSAPLALADRPRIGASNTVFVGFLLFFVCV